MMERSKCMKMPKIRFNDFKNEWKKEKLCNIVSRITRKNKNLESHTPLTISAIEGLVSQLTYFNNIVASSNISGYYLIKNGEFAYNKSYSNGFPYGSIKRLDKFDMGVLSTLYIVFALNKQNTSILSDYLVLFFNTTLWYHEVAKRAEEGARNHGLLNISADDFFDINIIYPKDLLEQQKIASYFQKLESLIQTTSKKLATLKRIKAASLQSMFPQEGETVPKVRFKGFEEEWEKEKLGNLFKERIENNINGELLSVTINNGIIKASDNGRFDNSNNDKSHYKVVKIGDIVYNTMRMWQGASGYSAYEGIVSPAYTVIIPQEQVFPLFFAYLFKTQSLINRFRIHSQGLTTDTWNLKFAGFSIIEVCFPKSKLEQQKIASYFCNLDKQISLQTQHLEKLKQIKAACLDKMFV